MPGIALARRVADAGAGEVWSGRVVGTGAACAVRVVWLPADAARRGQALAAGRRLVRLRHPHLVEVLAVEAVADGIALVMAAVPGAVNLARLLAARGRLDPGEVVTVGLPVAQALAAAHAAGLAHGALEAVDILLEPNGRPVLAGIGVAALGALGGAGESGSGPAGTPPVDVHDLADLLLDTMLQATGPDAAAVAVAVATALIDDPSRRPSAAELASSLAHSTTPLPVEMNIATSAAAPAPPAAPSSNGVSSRPGSRPGTARPGRSAPRGRRDRPGGTGDGGVPDVLDVVTDPSGPAAAGAGTGIGTAGAGMDAIAQLPRGTDAPGPPSRPPPRRGGQPPATPARPATATVPSDRTPSTDPSRSSSASSSSAAVVPSVAPTSSSGRMSGRTVRRGGSRVGRRGRGSTGRAPAWLLPLTAAVGLIAVGIAAVLLVSSADDRSGSSPRTGAGGPGASRPAAGEASTLPVAGRSSDQVWRSVLDGLGTARGRAFQDADEAELLEVYEQGSAVYVADVALMRDMVGRGAHVSALTTRILDLQVREDRPDRAVLRVTEQLDAYDFLDAHGAVLAHQPAKAPERRDVTLVRTASGWRVAGRTPVTGG